MDAETCSGIRKHFADAKSDGFYNSKFDFVALDMRSFKGRLQEYVEVAIHEYLHAIGYNEEQIEKVTEKELEKLMLDGITQEINRTEKAD